MTGRMDFLRDDNNECLLSDIVPYAMRIIGNDADISLENNAIKKENNEKK